MTVIANYSCGMNNDFTAKSSQKLIFINFIKHRGSHSIECKDCNQA